MTYDELVALVNQELNKKVKDLQEENRILKQAFKGDYEASQEIMGELKEENNKLSHLVANKVIVDYDYDSVLKRELIEERRKNIVLTESKNMTEKENKELKEQIKLFKKDLAKAEEICQKYNSRYYDIKLILSIFEKWLEEIEKRKKDRWEQFANQKNRQEIVLERLDAQIIFIDGCLDKLQELKGDNK